MPEPVEIEEKQTYISIFNSLPYRVGKADTRFGLLAIRLKYIFLVQSEVVRGV
jgi:hypothetical protein